MSARKTRSAQVTDNFDNGRRRRMMMSEATVETHISAEMRGAIGGLMDRQVSFPVSESDIRRWAIAVFWPDDPPRLYWDAEYAKTTRYGGIVAPDEFNPFAWMVAEKFDPPIKVQGLDPGRTEKMLGVEPPAVKFQLNGGQDTEYGVPMRPGDVITMEMKLGDYSEREGRHGLMLFTIFEMLWTNQNDELVRRTLRTLIRY
jgi:hypothetical protein